MCDNKNRCTCECPTELGYVIDVDTKTCKRVRRRLKEKCKTDMECSAAFSECSTGGCRCKKGFKRDGRAYNCVNNGKPLVVSEEVVTCSMRSTLAMLLYNSLKHGTAEVPKIPLLNGTDDWPQDFGDDCSEDYYCVPVFDDATKPGYYQVF
ncbi:hypothetical protein OESDEN_09396 [Oesophagostomum dentatum]|uniref:EB domain-containing protein n=1 Tax=Oesophagostomum dentatum TaxID=61180 RepID=A0A0B1T5T8_OESDE|nr:hypothetical protein OESDEN_09396 [Oesophagostomum dentatum]